MNNLSFSQQITQKKILENLSKKFAAKEKVEQTKLANLVLRKGWRTELESKNRNQIIRLTGVDINGFPIYTSTDNNSTSAATTHTNTLWQGGSTGFNLSGSSLNMKGKLAIWDGGIAMNNHIEINGRVINKDASSQINHSTHVSGTMIAKGINPLAKGMAYAVEELNGYDFNSHISEMLGAAANLLISNHSYGVVAGWNQTLSGDWEFWGNPGENEDYKFGIYNEETQMFDSIAYNAPNYLIVKSSGNNRDKNGPAVGQPYKRFDATGVMTSAGNRPIGISNNDSFDGIPTYGVAKNILTVGAIEGLPSGFAKPEDIKIGSFSSFGPTDDGRIKPDLVANGVDVFSCVANSTTSYDIYNGTSMATPNVSGSLFLLQELYSQLNAGNFMKSATLKALAIQTTTEAGTSLGPDYKFGWGVLNVEKAANIIKEKNTGTNRIIESVLNNGSSYSLNVIASGVGKLMATIVWTDPAAAPTTINLLNNPSLKLINDLDIRILKGTTVFYPWVLDPLNPNNAPTKGDNFRDNVERVEVDDVVPGENYIIQITHKGSLARNAQAFSLILSGVGGIAYCNSNATLSSGTRIDHVSFAGIDNSNPVNCTQYLDFTNLVAQIEPSKSYPLSVAVNTCDGSSSSKFIKVYIDYNNNGSFEDAGELVATSNLINTNTTFNTNVLTPSNLLSNNISKLRIVVQETNNSNSIFSCNPYLQGETQDYRIKFIEPSTDVSVLGMSTPSNSSCFNNNQTVSISLLNKGTSTISNINLSAVIKNGSTTVATLQGNYVANIESGKSIIYTFQQPFTTIANTNYSVEIIANLVGDQNSNNDTLKSSFNTLENTNSSSGQANICGNTVNLRALNTNSNQTYAWYNNINSFTPIATGVTTSSTSIATNYYLSSGITTSVGATSKSNFSDGDYQAKGGNYLRYTSTVPLLLEKAKLYTAYPGKVTITVADINTTNPDGSYSYKTLNTNTIDVLASRPTTATGDIVGNDPSDTGFVYNLNLFLPSGNHAIIVSTDSIANIFRNKNIASNPYPYLFSTLFSITGNNATNSSQYYYYLYNMRIRSLDCITEKIQIVPVTAAVPIITKLKNSLISSLGINYQWQKNTADILGANQQNYRPTESGNYTCRVTDNSGCEQISNTINFEYVKNSDELNIYPNPANTNINISLYASSISYVEVNIVDALGKIRMTKFFNTAIGNFNGQVNVSSLPNGIYTAHIRQDSNTYQKIFIIAR